MLAHQGAEGRDDLGGLLRLAIAESTLVLEVFKRRFERPPEKTNAARVAAAEVYISANIGRDIRKSELADHLGVSVSQLTLAFRDIGQLAVRDRLRFRRVESARNLLADSGLSVSEVAEKVGMNYRHFIRAFRQNALLTPLRYRKYSRRSPKPPHVIDEFLHTEHFQSIDPLPSLEAGRVAPAGVANGGVVSLLISNASNEPVVISRQVADGTFEEMAIVEREKRLSFLDSPGSIWRLEPRFAGSNLQPTLYQSGEINSHFVFGPSR